MSKRSVSIGREDIEIGKREAVMNVGASWKFGKLGKLEAERDPHETEFFKLSDNSQALVREVIQNSLDARRGSETVRVRFAFGTAPMVDVKPFFQKLETHLKAADFDSGLLKRKRVPFLTIEDFGTTGLDGSTAAVDRPEKGESNFYDFWWREGISGKGQSRAGRWGLGKTTLHMVSKIHTFWGYTLRHDDRKRLLMGKALLKTHTTASGRYRYCGFFLGDGNKPISDSPTLKKFRRTFLLVRDSSEASRRLGGRQDEWEGPGLSLVIPFYHQEDIDFESVVRAIVSNYFYTIASRKLRILVEADDGTSVYIDDKSLRSVANSWNWSGTEWENVNVDELMRFADDVANYDEASCINLSIDPQKPQILEDSFPDLGDVKKKFSHEEHLAFKVPVTIQGPDGDVDSYFVIHLKKQVSSELKQEYWFRAGIRIVEVNVLGAHPVIAMAVIEDEPLSEFLGDCETPAHTQWNERSEGFKEKYINGARVLRFVRNSMLQLVTLIHDPPEERVLDYLADVFFLPEEKKAVEAPSREPSLRPEEVDTPLPASTQYLRIYRTDSGFRIDLDIRKLAEQSRSLPLSFQLKAAYDTLRGDPFAQYDPADFDLSSMPLIVEGGTIKTVQMNEMRFKADDPNFVLIVGGFDPRRDVRVWVTEAADEKND